MGGGNHEGENPAGSWSEPNLIVTIQLLVLPILGWIRIISITVFVSYQVLPVMDDQF